MSRINQVVIVPDLGANKCSGRFSEQEMVQAYVSSLFEHLDEDRITVQIYHELNPIMPNSLVINCLGGWMKTTSNARCNITSILYGNADSRQFANMLQEVISDWGKCYADFNHRVSNPKLVEVSDPDVFSVSISPFAINGPSAESYMTKLDQLGREIAHCIMGYLITRSEQPKMMKVEYK